MTTEISRRHVTSEVQSLVLRYLIAETITAETAQEVAAAAVPLAATSAKKLRMRGLSVAEVTAYFAEKVAAASDPGRKFAAELFAAVWAGMQADYRETYGCEMS